ncbi:MAG TPA: alpha-ribazole kinase [Firmicutes bacterium]|nr:alpha-ribazole kinase [Bacillota bacterium]
MTRTALPPWAHFAYLDDVVAIPVGRGRRLLVACDSCAGIGDRAADVVAASPYVVGRFTCRVPLLEVLALGGHPFLVVATLGVSPRPTGQAVLKGAREEASLAGVPADNLLVSTEKNIPTAQTSAGITVLAWVDRSEMRFGRAQAGDTVVAVGKPKVGPEVGLHDPEIADIPTLRLAMRYHDTGDLIPVGSGGIAREAGRLARRTGLRFSAASWPLEAPVLPPGVPRDGRAGQHRQVNLDKSAGPATCFLVTVPPACLPAFLQHMGPSGRPCYPVGSLARPFPDASVPSLPGRGMSTQCQHKRYG